MISEIAKMFYQIVSGIHVFFVAALNEVFFIFMVVTIIGVTLMVLRIDLY